MQFVLTLVAVLVVDFGTVKAGDCGSGSTEIGGNWYCAAVEAIHYAGVGTAGSYMKITDMSGGQCSSELHTFSGPLSPLDEEVSIHFRGPIAVKQFAAYGIMSTTTSASISSAKPSPVKHLAQHLQKHRRRSEVTATIDGKVVSWVNNYFGPPTETDNGPATVTATIDGKVEKWLNNWFGPKKTPAASTATFIHAPAPYNTDVPATSPTDVKTTSSMHTDAPTPSSDAKSSSLTPKPASPVQSTNPTDLPAGTYERIGYYNAVTGTSEKLTFIGNYGGAGSGVFDEIFGASTAYLNAEGTGASNVSQILTNTVIPSDKEFAIFTDSPCVAGDSCGYVRPDSVAYHGFNGADKIFLFEVQMPMDGTTGFNADMPALWMLNAQIPRTLQYGDAKCSCWETGCGEFDIMEVLSTGSKYCKSTLHTNTPAGDSDYINRPTDSPVKIAVFFHSLTSAIHIQTLPDNYVFDTTIDAAEVSNVMNMTTGSKLSQFKVVE